MKINKIAVKNFRLLKNFEIYPENDLSLIIGKNNVGKTSFLSILDKFLNTSDKVRISFDDFNVDLKEELKKTIIDLGDVNNYKPLGISLRIFFEYGEVDNLQRIEKLMTNLDPENNVIILSYDYILEKSAFCKLRDDYLTIVNSVKPDDKMKAEKKDILRFLKLNHGKYFKLLKRSYEYDKHTCRENEEIYVDLDKEKISVSEIISFRHISAKRDVTNRDVDKTLSSQIAKLYKKAEASGDQVAAIDTFKDQLMAADSSLSGIYADLFKDVIGKVKQFGGVKSEEAALKIISSLQHRELLEGNTTVMYSQNGHELPESYNGLGYMNLLCIIFEIEIILKEIRRELTEKPADLNLLIIEEPEAHTHPQLQYVFIKNIKQLIADSLKREDGIKVELQCIISTHSAHIVSESNFDDIKYFVKNEPNSVIAKNLKDLKNEYDENGEENNFRFLKQYLTLHRSELFFADKCILIEGDTERILMPSFMRKLDLTKNGTPLMSQNISLVEVGAHSKIFERFIDFLEIKTLIITDIDSYYEVPDIDDKTRKQKVSKEGNLLMKTEKCPGSDEKATYTSNSSLSFFYATTEIKKLLNLPISHKVFVKREGKWGKAEDGNLAVIYQTNENGYIGRSFEDAFFHLNSRFIKNDKNSFAAITAKWLNKFQRDEISAFDLSSKGVGSKPSLAIEILLNSSGGSKDAERNWEVPAYIAEGLEWLRGEK